MDEEVKTPGVSGYGPDVIVEANLGAIARQHRIQHRLFILKTLILQMRIRHNYGNNYLRHDQ